MNDQFDFSFLPGPRPGSRRRRPDEPFRILVIGDWGGRAASGSPPPAAPAVLPVDFDTFDARLQRAAARVELLFGAERIELPFTSLDDFHPDALLQNIPALKELMDRRRQLNDPERAAQLLGRLGSETQPPASEPDPAPESEGSMFERLLGSRRRATANPATAGIEDWLSELVRPHLAPIEDPRVPDLVSSVESAAAGLLREVLHNDSFQRLESSWRGLFWLMQSLELGEELQIATLDLTKAELADLAATDDLQSTWLYRQLAEPGGADAARPSLVVALHEVDAGERDARTLAAMGALGAHGGFPFVATAARTILSRGELADDPTTWQPEGDAAARWRALRASPQAGSLGLVLPRLVLRLPYGAATDAIDGFGFEEVPDPPAPQEYLWGEPGLAVAMLLGAAIAAQGPTPRAIAPDVAGLPLHTWRTGDGVGVQHCTELLLSDRAVEAADAAGLMVLQGHAGRDAARLSRLRSISDSSPALAGPWQ